MKSISTLIAILFSGIVVSQAEITNGFDGFETWTSAEVGELPEHWDGFNRNVMFGPSIVGTVECVEKSSVDPFEGMYSAKLTSTSIMGGAATPGILTVGDFVIDWNAQDGEVLGGEAYTQLPTNLNGQFKFEPVGADTAFVLIWFFENGVEVGRGGFEFTDSTTSWAEFNVAINYDAGAAPDSMNVMFSSSNSETVVPIGTVLEIDAISLSSFLSVEKLETSELMIYPNPSTEFVTVELKETTNGTVQIASLAGVIVKSVPFTALSTTIDVSDVPSGTYLVIVRDGVSVRTEAIVIN